MKPNSQGNVQIDGIDIERLNQSQFVGVLIDDKISWKPQIKHVENKTSRSISVLAKSRDMLDQQSLYLCMHVIPI